MRLVQAKFSRTVKFQEYNDHQTAELTYVAEDGEIVDEAVALKNTVDKTYKMLDYSAAITKARRAKEEKV